MLPLSLRQPSAVLPKSSPDGRPPSQSLSSHVVPIRLVRSHTSSFLFLPDHCDGSISSPQTSRRPPLLVVHPRRASRAMYFSSVWYVLTTCPFFFFLILYDVRSPSHSFVPSHHNQGAGAALHQPSKAAGQEEELDDHTHSRTCV